MTIAPISRGAPSANRAAIVSRCGAPASVCVETVKLAEPVSGKLAAGGEIEAAKLRVAALFCTTTCTDPVEPRFPAASYACASRMWGPSGLAVVSQSNIAVLATTTAPSSRISAAATAVLSCAVAAT